MTFLQPALLWGALAVVIPILIHFWHQKKGTVLDWAATQWLLENTRKRHRGIQLDNLPLLLLRALLVGLLALLLSQPILPWAQKQAVVQQVHLVQPNATLVTNFRFELEEALKKGEPVYWMTDLTKPARQIIQLPHQTAFNALQLQTAITKIRQNGTRMHVYAVNNQSLGAVPAIYIPTDFQLHTVVDSVPHPVPYLLAANKRVFINRGNRLTSGEGAESSQSFRSAPAHTGPLAVLIQYRNKSQQQTVEAAVNALADVYALELAIDAKKMPGKSYDWVLTDAGVERPLAQTLYVISGAQTTAPVPTAANVIYTGEQSGDTTLTPQASELVENGQLPEWLGERLIRHYALKSAQRPLSRQQLNALFVPTKEADAKGQETTQRALGLLLLVLVGVERWIALTKNA